MSTLASALDRSLCEGVREGVFPGAVAAVSLRGSSGEERSFACAGVLEPGGALVELDTPYDLASLTKPIVAMAALRLAQANVLDLAQPLSAFAPELAGTLGGDAPLTHLLSHRAGLSPWGGLYAEIRGVPGSSEVRRFMLREAATRANPKPPAHGSVYSDLGYLLLGEALSRAAGMQLHALVEREVTAPLGVATRLVYPAALPEGERGELVARVAPTEQCSFRGRLVRGEVHDENCSVFGGVAGHAGLFGDAEAVLAFARAVLDALEGRSTWLDRALVRWALAPRSGGGSVLGWDTKSAENSSAGELFSPRSFGHLGFTGTSVWCDPARSLCAVLLSNRVHPSRDNVKIRDYRRSFHDSVMRVAFGLD